MRPLAYLETLETQHTSVLASKINVKVKVAQWHAYADTGGRRRHSVNTYASSVQDGVGWLAPRPGRFTPGKDPVPILGCVGNGACLN
jgi:hypothetical protein